VDHARQVQRDEQQQDRIGRERERDDVDGLPRRGREAQARLVHRHALAGEALLEPGHRGDRERPFENARTSSVRPGKGAEGDRHRREDEQREQLDEVVGVHGSIGAGGESPRRPAVCMKAASPRKVLAP